MAVKITYFKGNKLPEKISVNIDGFIVKCHFVRRGDRLGYFTPNGEIFHIELYRRLNAVLPLFFDDDRRDMLNSFFNYRVSGGWPELTLEDQVKLFKLIDEYQEEF